MVTWQICSSDVKFYIFKMNFWYKNTLERNDTLNILYLFEKYIRCNYTIEEQEHIIL